MHLAEKLGLLVIGGLLLGGLVAGAQQPGAAPAQPADRQPAAGPGPRGLFHPQDATVSDLRQSRFVWRDACGNSMDDHQLAGGFEWDRDARNYIALGEGWVRKERRGGLFMLSFPDGNQLDVSWPVNFPAGYVWRLRFALTDQAAASTRNGLKFTVVGTDPAGGRHTLVEQELKPRDERVYDMEIRFDFDPLYLPDDTIVFSSTREPKFNQCSRDHAANLFRMGADGADIHQIERNNLFDNQASLMPDGRILYARWEYVDRNFGDAHSLWTVWPDGTNQALYWGNNTTSPAAAYTARIIPGTDRAVCIFGPHHDHLWGAMAIVDPSLGLDGREPVVRIWPPEAVNMIRVGGPFDCDSFSRVPLKFADPYPLGDPATGRGGGRYFLCSRMTGPRPRRPGRRSREPEAGLARLFHRCGYDSAGTG